jgi:energy-converting hydrogenase Eha subunit C
MLLTLSTLSFISALANLGESEPESKFAVEALLLAGHVAILVSPYYVI